MIEELIRDVKVLMLDMSPSTWEQLATSREKGGSLRTSLEAFPWKKVLQSSVKVWATEVLAPV